MTKFIAKPESKDELRLRLFNELNEQPTSPLSGRMSSAKSVSGKLSHVGFKDAINPLLDTTLFQIFNNIYFRQMFFTKKLLPETLF